MTFNGAWSYELTLDVVLLRDITAVSKQNFEGDSEQLRLEVRGSIYVRRYGLVGCKSVGYLKWMVLRGQKAG